MCGIVGYLGNREARQILTDCLGRLDHRNADAAIIATIAAGKLKTLDSHANSAGLKDALKRTPLVGKIGIAHTYAASAASSMGAHADSTQSLACVYDGKIENSPYLKAQLERDGYALGSGTDSEIVARLLDRGESSLDTNLRKTIPLLRGTFSLVVLSQKEPDKIFVARKGSAPLVIGHHYDGWFVASDIPAISHYTRDIQVLEDGEMAVISYSGVKITRFDGTPIERPWTQAGPTSGYGRVPASAAAVPAASQLARA